MTTYEISVSVLEEHLQALTRERDELRRERDELKAFIRWEDALFAVPQAHMSAPQKITHRYLMQTYIGRPIDGTDRRLVDTPEMAKQTGRSVCGVRADIKHLDQLGLYRKSRVNEYHENAPPRTHMFLAPLELAKYPRLYEAEHPSQHGGKGRKQGRGGKKQCENCGSETIDIYQNYMCPKCNHIGTVEITHQHGDDDTPPSSPSSPTPNNQLDCWEDVSEEEEPSEPEEPEQSTIIDSSLVSPDASPSSPTPPNNQLDFRAGELPPNNQVASLITYKRDVQVDCSAPSTMTPNNQLDFREDEDEQTRTHALSPAVVAPATSLEREPNNQLDCFAYLSARPIWCPGRLEWPLDKITGEEITTGKKSKVPYNPRTCYRASSKDASTWGTYEETIALIAHSQRLWARPFDFPMLMCDGTFTFTEKDHCIINGVITADAQTLLADINSYAEWSLNDGVHIFTLGTIPSGLHRPDIEMYCTARPIVWTGKHIEGTPTTIENRETLLRARHAEYKPVTSVARANVHLDTQQCVCASLPFTDATSEQVRLKMFTSRHGATIKALYDGDIARYPSHSEADAALCNHLAYWTDCNREMIDSLFRQSSLMRSKWETHPTYAQETIDRAIAYVLSKK